MGSPICTNLLVDKALESGLSFESHHFEPENSVRRPERSAMASGFYSVIGDMVNCVSTNRTMVLQAILGKGSMYLAYLE